MLFVLIFVKYRAYEEAKSLIQKVQELAMEYRNSIENVKTLDDIIDAHEWFIESCIDAVNDNKRKAKSRVLDFRKELEKANVRLFANNDLMSNKDPGSPQNLLATGSGGQSQLSSLNNPAIRSKEFSHSDIKDFDISEDADEDINLKMRLLNEVPENKEGVQEIAPHDESHIGDKSVFDPLLGGSPALNQESVDSPVISDEKLRVLSDSKLGKVTPELYPNQNDDSDNESKESSEKEQVLETPDRSETQFDYSNLLRLD